MVEGEYVAEMKVLFINFNIGSTVGINNGIAAMSAVLKAKGHQVELIFLSESLGYEMNLNRLKKDINRIDPDIIGLSIMEPQFKYIVEFCEDIKTYYQGVLVVGGPHPTMDPETVLAVERVDAVCIGEGEEALCELVEAVKNGQDYTNIKNLWVKASDGSVKRNKLRPFIDLNRIPPEDKSLFDLTRILPLKNYQLETMASRGCAFKCAYCINGSFLDLYARLSDGDAKVKDYIRVKDVNTVLTEIKNVIRMHPKVRKIAFIDDNFSTNREFILEFCRRYKEEIKLPFVCNINPMSFNEDKGRLLKKAGCDDIRFGIESGSERVRKEIMRRVVTTRSVMNAFRITNELGLMSSSFNMIGLPTESKEEVFETFRLNAQLLPDTIKVMTFYPFKNTPLYDLCEELGLIDYTKKNELDDYDTYTCLKFSSQHQFFLRKIQSAFNWYINMFLNKEASSQYRKLVEMVEAMDEDEWDHFDYLTADKKVSQKLREKGVLHYSKFVNRSLAAKFPSRHFSQQASLKWVGY